MAEDYTPREVAELLETGDVQLVDVRQPHEHAAGHIAGSRLIELGRLSAETQTIDRARPVIFYCRSGGRSTLAADAFAQAGFDAHNLAGGMIDWQAVGLPIEPTGGHVADA